MYMNNEDALCEYMHIMRYDASSAPRCDGTLGAVLATPHRAQPVLPYASPFARLPSCVVTMWVPCSANAVSRYPTPASAILSLLVT